MPNSGYWKQRFQQLEAAQNRKGADVYAEIERQYRQAQKELEGKINTWYQRFADNNGVSMAEARRMLAGRDLKEFKWDVKDYIKYGQENAVSQNWMKELENASARFHISRLEALKLQTQQSLEIMFGNQLDKIDSAMKHIYLEGYYHTAYELQHGFRIGWDIAGLDQAQIEKVISKPWAVDGKNFSERIWGNKEKLITEVHNELTRNIMLGADPQKAIDNIARKMNTSKNNAGRLVMTEEAYFSSAAQKDCFNDLGVEEYEIVATLDSHTSDICQNLDGQHFPMKDFEPGITAPPFHVYCRSTTVPYFEDDFGQVGKRAARNEDGKTYYVPADMTYKKWKEAFVNNGDESNLQKAKANDTMKIGESQIASVIKELPSIEDIRTDVDRKAFAEKIIDNLRIDRTNIPVVIENMGGARGACSFYPNKDTGVCEYIRYSLQKDDNRSMKYQIKTAFHESYHLGQQGKPWDAVLDGKPNPKWVRIEETFAEAAAHYAAGLYGLDDISPAYAGTLIQTLPRLKQLPQYSMCSTLADFGKIAWDERLSGYGGMWCKLYEDIHAVTFNESVYYLQYFNYIRMNADGLIDKALENTPQLLKYKNQMKDELENAMQKVESGMPVSNLEQNESFIFPQVLINAMIREGVK